MPLGSLSLTGRLQLWLIANRLRSLQRRVFWCIWDLRKHNDLTDPQAAQLHLTMKALNSAAATTYLLKEDLIQEAEAPQRAFLEASAFLMYFTWFPLDPAFQEWCKSPEKPLDGRVYPIKPRVEAEIPNKLDLTYGQSLPVKHLFRVLSNTSVHPTRNTAERSWGEIARAVKFAYPDTEMDKLSTNLETITGIAKTVVFLVQLQLFLQFLRRYVLSNASIPSKYRQASKTWLEDYLNRFISSFRKYFKLVIKVCNAGYGDPI